MNVLKQPRWLRGLEVVTGLSAMALGVLVLAFPGWGVATLVVLLSMGLFFAGIRSLVLVGDSRLSKGLRALSVVAGILSLTFALSVLLFPGFAVLTLLITNLVWLNGVRIRKDRGSLHAENHWLASRLNRSCGGSLTLFIRARDRSARACVVDICSYPRAGAALERS